MVNKTRKISKTSPKKITAAGLFDLKLPTSLAISPDETRVAYTVEKIDKKENKYFSNLHVVDIASNEHRQYTHGHHSDGQPVWSPNGKQLAFVSTRDKKTGIYIIPVEGGAERKVIELEAAISNLQWRRDGKQLVLCLRYRDSHYIKDEKKKEAPVFRHITRLFHRLDGLGYLPKDRFQVYALDVETVTLRKITSGKRDNHSPHLSPDGMKIAFVSNRSRDEDLDGLRDDLFVIPFTGGRERRIPTPPGPVTVPVFSPDGKRIAFMGHDNPLDAWGVTNMHVWVVGAGGKQRAKDLMPKFDRMAYDQSISDTADIHDISPIFWSSDGKRVFFLSSDTGVTNLYTVPARGGVPTRIYRGKCHIKDYSLSNRAGKIALIHADLNNPGDLCVCPAVYGADRKAKRLTTFGKELRARRRICKTRDLFFKSFDGTEIQGWLTLPPNFNPNRRYPSILQIHGGPRVQYAHTFMFEMQYLASQGYVVFHTNPRGGSGRGELWADSIAGGWGDLDYRDCMAAADYLEKQNFIHPKKMCVTGGSYGGYMTNWLISHTNRFAAAVTQRSVVDMKSFVGSSDIGFVSNREFDGWPWTNEENYDKCSPISYFKSVKTPVLIIHSEQDLRCSIEQAQRMFVMLKVLRRKVEMVIFPEEPHGLSRHGRPDRRIARLEWINKWFRKCLK